MSENKNSQSDEVLLRLSDIAGPDGILAISVSSFWNGIAESRYPKPIRVGPRSVRWRRSSIMRLIDELDEQSQR